MDNEDEVVEIDEDERDNEDNTATDMPTQAIISGKLLKKLLRVPSNMTPDRYITELKSTNTAHEEYRLAIEDPLKTVQDRFKRLELDGQPVEVSDYAREEDVQILVDALTAFDLGYDLSIRSKTQLSKVPHIKAFLGSPDHCRITPFTLEYRICGKTGCTICAKIGRGVRAPDVEVGDYNLRTEVIRYMDLPVPNPVNLIHYLSPLAARASNDNNSLD
jgi:hypothetical protein